MFTIPWAVCAALTVISAAVSFGYSAATTSGKTGPARTASRYALVRSTALLATATVALLTGSGPFVVAIAVAMILIQAGDALIGARLQDTSKTVGPAAIAVVHTAAVIWLLST